MELKYKSTEKGLDNSFYVRRENIPYHEGNWHYHEEFELIYIIRGEGLRIVGDSLSNFRPPQLALVGPWLPHLWKNVESGDSDEMVDIIVIKFNELFHGQEIFALPEFSKINELLKQVKRGYIFGEKTIEAVHNYLIDIANGTGAERFINLMHVFRVLSQVNDFQLISSPGFMLPTTIAGERRLCKIIDFISNNFIREISLVELAVEAAMTHGSLCRVFKSLKKESPTTYKTKYSILNR